MKDELLTTGGLADAMHLCKATIRKWERLGILLPATRDSRGARLYYRSDAVPKVRSLIEKRGSRRWSKDRK